METHLSSSLRKIGIPYLDDIPWGTHICSFFGSKQDLLDILVPYFQAGLENNEYCIWIVSEPLTIFEARDALMSAIPDFDSYSGQIEFYNHYDWYLTGNELNIHVLLQDWFNKIDQAIANGYDGVRAFGSTIWKDKRTWKTYLDYEAMIARELGSLKMIALCPYQIERCGVHEILDLVQHHQFSFIKCQSHYSFSNSLIKYERYELVGKIAASIAHEIRNPMTSVKGFIQLLQSNKNFQSYEHYFSLMIDELDRANGIISEYLSLAGERIPKIDKHNLNNILATLLPLLQADARREDKDIILKTQDIEDIWVDQRDIRQVILNLVRNGLESMTPGGILEIRTFMHQGDVILEIEDNGHGIPADVLEHLGKPFITTKEQGTGLGLYVTYSILKRYHAVVEVNSSPNGTVFTIRFPAPITSLMAAEG